jgi:hypothetical protein
LPQTIGNEQYSRVPKEEVTMGIVLSLLLFTAGAIMRYAVTVTADGFDLHTAGVILMIVGVVGAVFSAINWATWGGFGAAGGRGATTVGTTTVTREREEVQ